MKVQWKILDDGEEIVKVVGISVEENIGCGWKISLAVGYARG